jgi:endonuclease VIII
MPEGDTIHRIAIALRPALVGRTLTRVELPRVPRPHPRVGATITGVEARGKHLLVRTDDGLTVHTHLRMTGSWHLYGPGQRWQKPARAARVVLAVDGAVAVCFSAPVVEVLDDRGVRRHPSLRALGPDLCDPQADLDEAARRLEHLAATDTTIGEALLDQRVACGIGNVYRCDVLFLHGLDPQTPLRSVEASTARALLEDASRLLRANLGGAVRTTVPKAAAGALWVHGRGGEPCRRCGTAIEVLQLGEQARYVYRCPWCQPPHRPAADGTVA